MRSLILIPLLASSNPMAEATLSAAPNVEERAQILLASEQSDASEVAPFAGRFTFAGGEEERAALERAIDEATEPMSVFTRGVARDRLRQRLQIPQTYDLAVDGDVVTVDSGSGPVTARIDGTPASWTNRQGETLEVVHRLAGGKLGQHFTGETGSRSNVFALTGDTLVLDVSVASAKLPRAVEFQLTYRRAA